MGYDVVEAHGHSVERADCCDWRRCYGTTRSTNYLSLCICAKQLKLVMGTCTDKNGMILTGIKYTFRCVCTLTVLTTKLLSYSYKPLEKVHCEVGRGLATTQCFLDYVYKPGNPNKLCGASQLATH